MHIEYPPKLSVSQILKQLKGRSSCILQKEFPQLKKRSGDNDFGQRVMEHGVQEILLTKWYKNILNTTENLQINLKTTFCLSNTVQQAKRFNISTSEAFQHLHTTTPPLKKQFTK